MKTPIDVAEQLGVDPDTVRAWCASGHLRAINVARDPRGKRPRWRISEEDLAAFLAKRANQSAPPTNSAAARGRGRNRRDVIEFF